jgi:kinesin family protein 5
MKVGADNRAISATEMNAHSSRSHSIFIMTIHQNNIKDLTAKTGKLFLVDLAGSEKISKTGATGLTLEEAKTINRSLTTLGMVINNLTDGKSSHVPYRESKLTRVLQESLGGNAKTCLIITCSPSTYNEAETLSTLRFGLRAKKIKNKPKVNREVTVAELKIEIEKLEKIITSGNKRIAQLEDFIKKNSLQVPHEADYSFMTLKSTAVDDSNFAKEIEESLLEQEAKKENDRQFLEMSVKYSDFAQRIVFLEGDKRDLNEKLEGAILKLREYNETIEEKGKIIEELESMKLSFESREVDLFEKISELEEKLEIQRNAVGKNENEIVVEKVVEEEDELIKRVKEMLKCIRENKTTAQDSDNTNTDTVSINQQSQHSIHNNEINQLFKLIKNELQLSDEQIHLASLSVLDLSSVEKLSSLNSSPVRGHQRTASDNNMTSSTNSQPLTTEEIVKKERKKYDHEKKLILKALDEKTDKIGALDSENKELKDRIKLLESKMNPEDKNYVKKILTLEKNLEQVNLMYHQVVTQKSVLKIENQVLEKKIKKRSERVTIIEKENQDLREQLKMRDDKLSFLQKSHSKVGSGPNNVVKVIKGGHCKFSFLISLIPNLFFQSNPYF